MGDMSNRTDEVRLRHFPRVTVGLVLATGIALWVHGAPYYRLPRARFFA